MRWIHGSGRKPQEVRTAAGSPSEVLALGRHAQVPYCGGRFEAVNGRYSVCGTRRKSGHGRLRCCSRISASPRGLANGICALKMVAGARNQRYLQLWSGAA
jgi:hypothetical protein